MADDSAAITSEAVKPSTHRREEGRIGALPGWRLTTGSRNCGEHSVSCCRHQGSIVLDFVPVRLIHLMQATTRQDQVGKPALRSRTALAVPKVKACRP